MVDNCMVNMTILSIHILFLQTIPTYIWVIMGVLGAAMLAIVIGLTAAAALQANYAAITPRSIVDNVMAHLESPLHFALAHISPTPARRLVGAGQQLARLQIRPQACAVGLDTLRVRTNSSQPAHCGRRKDVYFNCLESTGVR